MPKKPVHKKTPTSATSPKSGARKLHQSNYRSFRLSKSIKQPKPPLTGGLRLFRESVSLLWQRKRLFGWLLVVVFLLNTIFVRGVSSGSSITDLKGALDGIFTSTAGHITTSLTLFSVLLTGSSSTQTETASLYQGVLLVIASLAFIWAIRQSMAEKKHHIRVRDAFYKGMYPLVPFLGVLVVMGLQLMPLSIGNFLYSTAITGGLAVTVLEKVLWLLLIALLAILSFYMLTSSVFALYIVTLADVDPMQALRSARELVRFRRWTIMRRLFVLPLCLLLIGGAIVMPLIVVAPALAEWVFYFLSSVGLLIVHSYLYNLYRKLL